MDQFITLDFETANEMRASACQVGLVRASTDGSVLDQLSVLIKPDEGFDHFRPLNIGIHGITPADVSDAPTMSDIADHLVDFIGDLPIVAHNMAFDYSVWRAHSDMGNLPTLENPRLCTLRMARSLFVRPTGTNGLKQLVSEYLPGASFNHHDALSDSLITAQLFTQMLRSLDTELEDLVTDFGLSTAPRIRRSTERKPRVRTLSVDEWETSTLLEEERVCFTGALARLTRSEVHQLVEKLGGHPDKGVTQKTTKLVIGVPNPSTWRPDTDGSSKMVKARALAEKGSSIEVMTEDDFFSWIAEL